MPSVTEIREAIDAALLAESHAAATIFIPPSNVRGHQCSCPGCTRPAYSAALCNAHYLRKRKGQPMEAPVRARKRGDLCVDCGRETGAKGGWGLCPPHYKARRYRAIKRAVVAIFGGQCSVCNGKFPLSVFDLHHLRDKEDAASSLFMNASSLAVAKEASKCVLLCANCHRIEHSEFF